VLREPGVHAELAREVPHGEGERRQDEQDRTAVAEYEVLDGLDHGSRLAPPQAAQVVGREALVSTPPSWPAR